MIPSVQTAFFWMKAVFLLLALMAGARALDITTIPGTGTAGGEPCYIPFEYEGETFYSCTYAGKKVAWCATTADPGEWGQCPVDAPGSFPKVGGFIFFSGLLVA